MKKHYLYIAILTAISTLLFHSCTKPETLPEEPATETLQKVELTEVQAANAGLATAKPSFQPVAGVLNTTGRVDLPPDRAVMLSVPIGGTISEMNLLPGTPFKKGQVLAEVSDMAILALKEEYLLLKLDQALMKAELDRLRLVRNQDAAGERQFKKVETELQKLAVRIGALRGKLQLLSIDYEKLDEQNLDAKMQLRAPFDGFVGNVLATKGSYVKPESVIAELIDPQDLHLMFTVLEPEIGQLEAASAIEAESPAFPGKIFTAKILLLGRSLNAQRQLEVHAHFDQVYRQLFPGLFMQVRVKTQSARELTVPSEAVVRFGAKEYCFRKIGALAFEPVEVITSGSSNGRTAIRSGLSTEDEIATRGAYVLLMKWKNAPEED
jgi:cobalt-zinc-cadmium efflux system membrane fusion protein